MVLYQFNQLFILGCQDRGPWHGKRCNIEQTNHDFFGMGCLPRRLPGQTPFQKHSRDVRGTSLTNSAEEWLQVDLRERTSVTRVAAQGRTCPYCCQWVSKYKLQYNDDGVTFQYYKEQGQITDKVTSYRQLNFGIRYPISVYGY